MSLHRITDFAMTTPKQRIQPNREAKKYHELLRVMHQQFEPYLSVIARNRTVTSLRATDVLHDVEEELSNHGITVSRVLILRARHALGIRSTKSGNGAGSYFLWNLPTHTPEQIISLKRQNQQRALEKRVLLKAAKKFDAIRGLDKHPDVQKLRSYMITCGCEVSSVEVLKQFQHRSKPTIQKFKRALGIVSIKRPDNWYWVYPAPEVREWLMRRLSEGPLPFDQLKDEADEAGWSRDVLRCTRTKVGGIGECYIDSIRHWFDVNQSPNLVRSRYGDADDAIKQR